MSKRAVWLLCLVVVLLGAMTADAQLKQSKMSFAKAQLTANGTLTYDTYNYINAQVTITKDAGTPDGTLSIVTRPSATGGQTVEVPGYVPAGTKTWEGPCQNVLEVTLGTHTTGTIGVEVVLW